MELEGRASVKSNIPAELESKRVLKGRHATEPHSGWGGAFMGVDGPRGKLNLIIGIGLGWEHVSVTTSHSTSKVPSWKEMCFVKDLCWDGEECVVQYHPPKSSYVNIHPAVLHLWKPTDVGLPRPPSVMV